MILSGFVDPARDEVASTTSSVATSTSPISGTRFRPFFVFVVDFLVKSSLSSLQS